MCHAPAHAPVGLVCKLVLGSISAAAAPRPGVLAGTTPDLFCVSTSRSYQPHWQQRVCHASAGGTAADGRLVVVRAHVWHVGLGDAK